MDTKGTTTILYIDGILPSFLVRFLRGKQKGGKKKEKKMQMKTMAACFSFLA